MFSSAGSTAALLFSMIFNGIILFPPSEYVYLAAFLASSGNYSLLFIVLPISNTFGHFVLFMIFKRWHLWPKLVDSISERADLLSTILNHVISLSVLHSERYLSKYDGGLLIVAYGRCIPVVHSGISIVAAQHRMAPLRFILYTLLGNLVFSHFWFFVLSLLGNSTNVWRLTLFATAIIVVMYVLHILIARILPRRSFNGDSME